MGIVRTSSPNCLTTVVQTKKKADEIDYLMQTMLQIPILQVVAGKTVGNPVSTEEKSTIKAAILRPNLQSLEVGGWSN